MTRTMVITTISLKTMPRRMLTNVINYNCPIYLVGPLGEVLIGFRQI